MRDIILKGSRKIYRILANLEYHSPICETDRSKANDYIYELLSNNSPCMISRFGTIEIGIVTNYLALHSNKSLLKRSIDYITDNTGLPWWDKLYFKSMKNNAGIFPETTEILERFSKRYLRDIPEIDLLGSFNYAEKFMPLRSNVVKVHLECLYPFWAERPWTLALCGKKVLVVHPFVETIKTQYTHREKLFDNLNLLPEYELKTLRAVQSNAGAEVPYKDWFEALKWMEDEIDKIDFDICILGCGAYGLPLAATIKRMGKKAIHLGGGSQLLFGIKGKRWDNDGYHWKNLPQLNTNYSSLYNDYWVRPSQNETPSAANKVEGACYW
ncbi:hypothetical protein Bacsa_2755 [Phocaeicola salanitronis DSM 18170]|uniref:Glycosyltransferase GT-D fold domain-containing protein n=1 Tax=Phocaeicola salanitronis (strain DSM 18170 / JCM 13657 / CCUG 60908 / BL78) TaxID=667015 RepID=F0R0E4_PHOSB|nr:hypothetical protein [Phocaeicola salanitronis]ADY37288.1 hypothetical protein Bacsa_2755 [Phocaeicola salanitronis DSM 18170]